MSKEIKKQEGFDPRKERDYLERIEPKNRSKSLETDLITQLAEDLGFVEFTIKYNIKNNRIIAKDSDKIVLEMVKMGGCNEEFDGFKMIEDGLMHNPEKAWVYFSPKNDILGYPVNYLDFWRVIGNEVIWNRISVKNDFEKMKEIREQLGGIGEAENETKILAMPVQTDKKLSEIFAYFTLADKQNSHDYQVVSGIVKKYLNEFTDEFGNKLTENSSLILRLYSFCFRELKKEKINLSETINREKYRELEMYMYGIMNEVKTEKSSGCSGSTQVASFQEGYGFYIVDGKAVFGKIPEGFKECKQCGCYYSGDKCPFC